LWAWIILVTVSERVENRRTSPVCDDVDEDDAEVEDAALGDDEVVRGVVGEGTGEG